MKHITLFLSVIVMIGGCASWPEEGQGGWAEHYSQHKSEDGKKHLGDTDHVFSDDINVVTNEFEHLVMKLDLLKAQGIRDCMPAQLLKAQVYENRIRRLISAQMWADAEHDLLIHYHGLNQLSGHFEMVQAMTKCAPKNDVVVVKEVPVKVRNQITDLLNSDNQFAFDDYQITPKYMGRIAQAADLIKQVSDVSILLVGHTDKVGNHDNNYELALKRAETVKHWLGVYGVQQQTITTLTQGSLQPYNNISNSDAERHSDRRVEAIILSLTEINNGKPVKAGSLVEWTKVIKATKE
ncbi:OmpA family protein [Pseudoalteromonas sp. MMG012]|uniref:OmpA family protein n=1 Tax=Pseudoalteromonas sp. MMG012 TaxID=2822686 RepID=UPI001B3A1038|nr:OmpA family protein [Pseudoalteromonas sp. MMG012]MBQ4851576.1 OmpA family protein [Pseudoalteromonas sp. MMG012]